MVRPWRALPPGHPRADAAVRRVRLLPALVLRQRNAAGRIPDRQSQSGESQAAAPQLFLQITDANANPVLLSETAFVPVTGMATYQAVILPAGEKKLGDLPANIRAVALPDLKSASR